MKELAIENPSEVQKFDTVNADNSYSLERGIEKARESVEAKTGTSTEKAGDSLARLPRLCHCVAHCWVVLAQFALPVTFHQGR
jgi:hypothetical protein